MLGGYRVAGPTTETRETTRRDGTALDLEAGLAHRSYRNDGFATTTYEGRISGRLDLFRLGPTLRGAFTELQVGLAVAKNRYTIGASEWDTILLTRFAFGMYLGRSGELAAHYDHRRDGLAGGMIIPGIGAGFLGSAGLSYRTWLGDTLGLSVDGTVGAAWILGGALLVRQGGQTW